MEWKRFNLVSWQVMMISQGVKRAFSHLSDDGFQQRPQPFHSTLFAQVLDHSVPVEVDDPQRGAGQPLAHRAQSLREML